jgi:tetratricopeptide (TPR) repeat protein
MPGRLSLQLGWLLAVAFAATAAEPAGNQACAGCHAAIYQSFVRTAMAQSSGTVGTGTGNERFEGAEFRDSAGKFAYRVGRSDGAYYFEFREEGTPQPIQGRRQLEYFVGSGAAARSYLLRVDGFLYEAPVTYYHNSDSWKSAPGYAGFDYPYLTRPILPGCLQCHASRIQWISGTQNAYAPQAFLENGVSCERCHGSADQHLATGKPMINPAKLAPAERDSICEQCHLSGEIRVPKPGMDEQSFRPGARLRDFVTVFVRAGSTAERKVTSHVENLAQSACKRASGDKMWCGSCHDPHFVPAANQKADYFRRKCLTCHQASDCGEAQTARQANGDDCAACHMPRNPVSDVDHVVFTDHSIRKRPSGASQLPPATAQLAPFGGGAASERDLGLGYAMVAVRGQNRTDRERAIRLLQQAAAQGTADAQALAYLAEFYRDRGDDARALPLYQKVWQMDRAQYAAAAALGAYQMQRGNLEEAIRLWNQALTINPAMVLVRVNLAKALVRTGQPAQAQATLRKALQFNPSLREARDLLAQIAK